MYLIEFDNVYDVDIMKKAYERLGESGIITKAYVMHTISKETEIIRDFPSHCVRIDVKALEDSSNDDILDLIMSVEYGGKSLVVDGTDAPTELIQQIRNYCDTLRIDYFAIGKECLEDSDIPSGKVAYVVKELYNHPNMEEPTYGFKDFLIRFKINTHGEVHNHLGEKVGDLDSSVYRTFLNLTDRHISMIENIENKMEEAKEIGISLNLAEPWYYLGEKIDPYDIIQYKSRIFDLTKNMTPYQINDLPMEIVQELFECRFLSLGDIIAIENKNHDLFITDWFIQAIE